MFVCVYLITEDTLFDLLSLNHQLCCPQQQKPLFTSIFRISFGFIYNFSSPFFQVYEVSLVRVLIELLAFLTPTICPVKISGIPHCCFFTLFFIQSQILGPRIDLWVLIFVTDRLFLFFFVSPLSFLCVD